MCEYQFEILILAILQKYEEVRLLDHMVVLFSVSCGMSILFSIAAALFCIPTKSVQGIEKYLFKSLAIF